MPEQCLIVSVRVAIRGSVSGTPSSPTAPAKSTLVSLPDQLRLPPPQARGTAAAHIAKSATARALLLFVVSARETRFVPRLQRDELPHCQGWGWLVRQLIPLLAREPWPLRDRPARYLFK